MTQPKKQARGTKIVSATLYDAEGRETDDASAVNGVASVEGGGDVLHYERPDTVRKMYPKRLESLDTTELNKRFRENS